MTNGDGILARLVSWHTYPGTKAPWWGIPALLMYDGLGFLSLGWVIFDLQKADAGLAMHADVVKIMPAVAIVILSLPALFPLTHVIAVIVNVGRRRRRPVLGLKEDQWWRIMAILASAWFLIAVTFAWMIGAPLHARALTSGYIDCDSLFEPANPGGRGGPPPTYVLSADLCLKAGFRRSRNRTGS